ncbi:MAG: adenylyltransferase/cytidyltransferase family protein [Fibrobacterota bacterium]
MTNRKILTLPGVLARVRVARKAGHTIVTTNGCFDLLHPGHAQYLAAAKKLGTLLFVGVNSDASVRANKGPGRPVNNEQSRMAMLAALSAVDGVFVFREKDPIRFIEAIRPNIHVKGGDYQGRILEQDAVERSGGRVRLLTFLPGHSTTRLIARIVRASGRKKRKKKA